jgi:hypothetical protein
MTLLKNSSDNIEAELNKFAYTVIGVSGKYLYTQCKEKMQVLAKHQGSGSYPGPALIVNLIKLSSAMCAAVVDDHNNYMYFHSKAVSILMEKVDKGGCFAAGPLTSQGLLNTMAALGLIPIKFANCGGCGACLGGSKSNAVNLVLRLSLYHFLHMMSS